MLGTLFGAVLLVCVACYIFGTTVYLTDLSPNEFLFDTTLLAVSGAAMGAPLVPTLVVKFAFTLVSTGLLAALSAGRVGVGINGLGLYRRSLAEWTARYREGWGSYFSNHVVPPKEVTDDRCMT